MNIHFSARYTGDFNTISSHKARLNAAGKDTFDLGQNNDGDYVLLSNEDLPHANVFMKLEEGSKRPEMIKAIFQNFSSRELDEIVRDNRR